jgi:hypothetical protein
MDPDTYLAHLSSKKSPQMLSSMSNDFDKKGPDGGQFREISPWTDKKAKNPTAVDIMIKKKKDV